MGLGAAPPHLPPDVREGLRLHHASYSSEEIQKLNTECMTLVVDLRVKQKELDKKIKQHLSDLDKYVSAIEDARGNLVLYSTRLLGYEKIAKTRAKALKDADKKGDAKKKAAIEKQIKTEAEGYAKALKDATRAAARIELNREKLNKIVKALQEAGKIVPEASQLRHRLPDLKFSR